MLGVAVGLVTLGLGRRDHARGDRPRDGADARPRRRNLLVAAGSAGSPGRVGGPTIGWTRPQARPRPTRAGPGSDGHRTSARSTWSSCARTYHPGGSGDLQLLLAPYNSANYPQESLSLVPQDPRTSHASRVDVPRAHPARRARTRPGRAASDSEERVTLADLAPTTAQLIGFDELADDRRRRAAARHPRRSRRPRAARGRDLRDRRRWVERPRRVARRLAEPEGRSWARARTSATRSPARSPR